MVKTYTSRMVISVIVILFTGAFIYATYANTPPVDVPDEQETTVDIIDTASTLDVEAALAQRVLGDESAPVTIQEFASLSCSHCATFHKETFSKLKEEYIDTGKIRFIFTDFPLNASALAASMVARCLPEQSYFKFISFLFNTQDDWAFAQDYQKKLNQNAKLLGLNDDDFKECMNNMTLRTGLAIKMEAAKKKHGIKSTPSFVINGKELITGSLSIDVLRKLIDGLLPENEGLE